MPTRPIVAAKSTTSEAPGQPSRPTTSAAMNGANPPTEAAIWHPGDAPDVRVDVPICSVRREPCVPVSVAWMTPIPMMEVRTTRAGTASFVSRYIGNAKSIAAMLPPMWSGRRPILSVRAPAANATKIATMLELSTGQLIDHRATSRLAR